MKNNSIREKAVLAWLTSGIKDFYVGFFLEETHLMSHAPFYYAQGLEKICKGYLIGYSAVEYENKNENEAKIIINKIAKKHNHNIDDMINELIGLNILDEGILTKKEGEIAGHIITGKDCISILQTTYFENRYPTPNPTSTSYPIDKNLGVYFDPIQSSEPKDFAYTQGFNIIRRAEQEFNLKEGLNNQIKKISKHINANKDDSWVRFCRIFFKN